jgi:hypothetical protein
MNKRMKDPKGDLRFVHKSTRVYDFWSLKLTAMACGRQARIISSLFRRYFQSSLGSHLLLRRDLGTMPARRGGYMVLCTIISFLPLKRFFIYRPHGAEHPVQVVVLVLDQFGDCPFHLQYLRLPLGI